MLRDILPDEPARHLGEGVGALVRAPFGRGVFAEPRFFQYRQRPLPGLPKRDERVNSESHPFPPSMKRIDHEKYLTPGLADPDPETPAERERPVIELQLRLTAAELGYGGLCEFEAGHMSTKKQERQLCANYVHLCN